ncbi:MAG: YabP/YqfC family sporulation protein, partial [Clostridia bacterium]|nr:YabP/YqfC family sporulation protein [Clostridia bacterium]
RVVNIGGKSVYIEGIKSVVRLDNSEMIFQMKNCGISVVGNELKIKYLDKTTCVITGKIKAVSCQ